MTGGEALHTAELEPAHVLDSLGMAVVAIDSERRVLYLNRRASELTGWSAAEARGVSCHRVLGGTSCAGGCLLTRALAGEGEVELKHTELVARDGGAREVWLVAAPLTDAEGRVAGVVEAFRPIPPAAAAGRRDARYASGDVITCDRLMLGILEVLPVIAASDTTVLIGGETGTGKDLLAKVLHNLSPRAGGPFVKVNCAALPENLLESELFGFVRGAFTGAERDKPGRFALAGGGTIFLDEIGELPLGLQAKLLRVLEDRTYYPLGSPRVSEADVRVLVATNRKLQDMVADQTFREDLFYRLNVVHFELPALRERRADLPLLIQHFLGRLSLKENRYVRGISDEALQALLAYHYPGNVRELQNILEHALILCQGDLLGLEHLPASLRRLERQAADDEARLLAGRPLKPVQDVERRRILAVLKRHGWRRKEAAADLGMDRTTLWRKMKRYGLVQDEGGRG